MTNADKFKIVFDMYSEEFWAKPEEDMLNWINSEYQEPTSKVDIQPVKHGRWIQLTQDEEYIALKCSLCGEISCCCGTYCPDCGARMDGEEND